MPAKNSTRLILRDELLRFEMDSGGNIIHGGNVVDMRGAESLIRQAQSANPNTAVILTIDRAAMWQQVVSFVELAQDLKIDSFSFSMNRETP